MLGGAWAGAAAGEPLPPVPESADDLETTARKLEALAKVEDEDVNAENASWLASEMTYALLLVIVVAKANAAHRDLAGSQAELSALEMDEVQTAHKVVALAMDSVNQIYERLNVLSRSTNSSKGVSQAREHAIKSKMAS
ncbi:hypothetical protein F503_00472 [Ophiostoma piceae UAMH 11346]|uniref:Uncharacterized protein n=1 Tax=Ophiostoma piceae (strain UAMH 11346) TaxID=1262450 RepID=S3D380_OPHP1|nr:hypothetical protein F503_00472 [Ophiostoma piceae UAMH 11346]